MRRLVSNTPAMLTLMALALALVQRGGALLPALAGLLIFGALALPRPYLGLVFVPLAAPLYLIPAAIQGLRADASMPFRLPLYEVVLLVVLGATVANWLWRRWAKDEGRRTQGDKIQASSRLTLYASRFAPHLLFLLAGVLGVALAAERARALRELRWLIVEPLIFYGLVRLQLAARRPQETEPQSQFSMFNSLFTKYIVVAFVLSGATVGLLGLLQFVGLDLAPLLGRKECFAPDGGPCANVVVDGGVRRVLSVYGHPNNLGLYLGRVWPVAAALAIVDFRLWFLDRRGAGQSQTPPLGLVFWAICALLALGGIVVSFSRGAWLGALAALAVLALGATSGQGLAQGGSGRRRTNLAAGLSSFVFGRSSWRWLAALAIVLVVLAGLALSIRGDITGGSTPIRLLLWREALGYIQLHPLGIGLDQFGYYHDPQSGLSLIDPALIGTSEQYAAHPHNLFLDIWLRLGPLGLLAFGWLLARFARGARREEQARGGAALALGATAAMAAALAHGMVDNFYFVPDLAVAFWLLIALVESATIKRHEDVRA